MSGRRWGRAVESVRWRRSVRLAEPTDIVLPRWSVAFAFVMLAIGLVHAAVTR